MDKAPMNRWLRILALILGAALLAVVAAAIVLPLVIDPNDYRDEIGALVSERTGRSLNISGDLSLSVFPWLGIEVGEVSLANAPGFGPEPMA